MNLLRELRVEDQEMIRGWRNNPDIRKYMYTDHEISAEEHRAWFSLAMGDPTRKYWIIVCDGEDVGLVNLYNIDPKNRRCYWAFYVVSPNVRGKGVGSFAEFSALRFVFEDMRFKKLCCEVLAFNQGVVRMHTSFGFTQEGLFRQHILKEDVFIDVVCLAMLREEWEARKAELEQRLKAKSVI